MLLPLNAEFGAERAAIMSIYALAVFGNGIGGPLVGRVFDRAGPRVVFTGGVALLGSGLTLAGSATQLWQLQLCLDFAVGIGAACLGNVPSATLLGRWFGRRLTLVTSIV